jgi:hypothetical protein
MLFHILKTYGFPDTTIKAILEISEKRLGVTAVTEAVHENAQRLTTFLSRYEKN